MQIDFGPALLLGVFCFCLLVGLLIGIAAFLFSGHRWLIGAGFVAGIIGFVVLKRTVFHD